MGRARAFLGDRAGVISSQDVDPRRISRGTTLRAPAGGGLDACGVVRGMRSRPARRIQSRGCVLVVRVAVDRSRISEVSPVARNNMLRLRR